MIAITTGRVACEVYYNGKYVSVGGADAVIRLSVLAATGARHVIIEPRTLAVPLGHTVRLRCICENDDDDDDDDNTAAIAVATVSWTWLVNGHMFNDTGRY